MLSGVLANRILGLSEEWAGIREDDFVHLCAEFRGTVRSVLEQMVNGQLLARVEDRYYMADAAMKYVSDRDRISLATVRARALSYLDAAMVRHRHDLEHNTGMLEIVRVLQAHGITVYGGWRAVVHIPRATQVQPDGVIYADGPFGRGEYRLEYERSATTPQDVLEKLGPYRRAAAAGVPLWVIWVCETRRGATRFLGLSRGLQAMVTTLGELKAGEYLALKPY